MSEQAIKSGDTFISNEDRRRSVIRSIKIERLVRAKRVYDKVKQEYAVGISRIDADANHPSMVGKKRRVFIKVNSLLSAQYSRVTPLEPKTEPDTIIADDLTHDLARPASCEKHDHRTPSSGMMDALRDAGLETVPGL